MKQEFKDPELATKEEIAEILNDHCGFDYLPLEADSVYKAPGKFFVTANVVSVMVVRSIKRSVGIGVGNERPKRVLN